MRIEEYFQLLEAAGTLSAAREFVTYPHHKHVGEVIQASHAPTLREVLQEIVAALP